MQFQSTHEKRYTTASGQMLDALATRQSGIGKAQMTSAYSKESDSALVAATRRGEAPAFESLMSRYDARVFAVAFRITRNREDAQDIAQQSFHKAFMHLDTFRGKASFSTWLTRIAINEALMHIRKRRSFHELSLERFPSKAESCSMEIPDAGKSPAEIFEEN